MGHFFNSLLGLHSYYVVRGGNEVEVVVAESRFRHKYLKTKPDGEEPNNLLALPECP